MFGFSVSLLVAPGIPKLILKTLPNERASMFASNIRAIFPVYSTSAAPKALVEFLRPDTSMACGAHCL